MMPSTRATLQVNSAFQGTFLEKIWPGPEKFENVAKTTKIEGYSTHFRTFPGPELCTPRDASYINGRSLEMSHVAWNEYVDAFTFISRQFWILTRNEQMRC